MQRRSDSGRHGRRARRGCTRWGSRDTLASRPRGSERCQSYGCRPVSYSNSLGLRLQPSDVQNI